MSDHTPEIDRLRAEVQHWKDHAEEAGRGFSQVCKDYARVAARNSELVRQVETLAESWETEASQPGGHSLLVQTYRNHAREIRAAVSAPPGRHTPTPVTVARATESAAVGGAGLEESA